MIHPRQKEHNPFHLRVLQPSHINAVPYRDFVLQPELVVAFFWNEVAMTNASSIKEVYGIGDFA